MFNVCLYLQLLNKLRQLNSSKLDYNVACKTICYDDNVLDLLHSLFPQSFLVFYFLTLMINCKCGASRLTCTLLSDNPQSEKLFNTKM